MPFTFFAHQVPVIPLKTRWPDRWDGVGLVIGSIIPDLWYVSNGWLYGPAGIPMWVDGHRIDLIIQNCVLPGLIITVLLRRWVMPVIPAALPKAGFLRIHDYRLLAFSKHRWWVTAYSVGVGALTHIVLDAFTHKNGAVVEAFDVFSQPLFTVGGHSVALYKILQFGGHVFGSMLGVYLLLLISRRKLQWSWHGWVGRPPDPIVRPPGVFAIRAMLGVGALLGIAYGISRVIDGDSGVAGFMAFCCVMLLTLLVTGAIGRRWVEPLSPQLSTAVSPASIDPVLE